MNYGETLAYWYLRLNGFFPLRDFVHHMPDDRNARADCDLLAIRFPHVTEDIGGAPGDWDAARFEGWGLPLAHPIALIVQVKTGTGRAACTAGPHDTRVAKLLIASSPCSHPEVHLSMLMGDAVAFIRRRFQRYRDPKAADRLLFNDELIQFLASREDQP